MDGMVHTMKTDVEDRDGKGLQSHRDPGLVWAGGSLVMPRRYPGLSRSHGGRGEAIVACTGTAYFAGPVAGNRGRVQYEYELPNPEWRNVSIDAKELIKVRHTRYNTLFIKIVHIGKERW